MIDKQHMVCTAQAFTTEALSEYSYDQEKTGKLTGHAGKPLVAHIVVTTAFTTLTSGVRIHVVTSDAAALTSDTVLASFPPTTADDDGIIAVGDLDAIGDHLQCVIPPGVATKQYLGINFVPVSEAAGAWALDAWFDDQMEPPAGT